MLSAIPFRVDGILYLILFGEDERYLRLESPRTVFLHITNTTIKELKYGMARGIAHLGFGHGRAYVRDTPRDPQIQPIAPWNSPNDSNCLATIAEAIGQYLVLYDHDKRKVYDHLSKVIGDLIKYAHNGLDDLELHPIKHLSHKQQTYVELLMLLNTALCLRYMDGFCEGADCCSFPIHCFNTTDAFAIWLKGWTRSEDHVSKDDHIVLESEKDGVLPVWRMLNDSPTQTRRATEEPTDLSTKKRKLDELFVATTFYNED